MRIDLVIRKEGSQWCLFTADGSRKLGCHDTKEGAMAQEAAVRSNEAKAASLAKDDASVLEVALALSGHVNLASPPGRVSVLFDSKIDTSKAVELEDGSARMEVLLAPEGTDFENGRDTFNLEKADLETAIQNFVKRGGPVPVTIGHWPDDERQRQGAAAWIENLTRKTIGDKSFLAATMRFLSNTWGRIKNDEFKFLSMEFWTDDTDQHGNSIGMNIDGAAILNYPFFPLRFDQSKKKTGRFLTLGRFAGESRRAPMDFEVKEVNGKFHVFGKDGKDLGSYASKAEADAEIVKLKAAPPAADTVTVPKTELEKLQADSRELVTMKQRGGGSGGGDNAEVVQLRRKVDDLEKKDAVNEKRTRAQRVRLAVDRLTKPAKEGGLGVHVALGDHKLEDDDGAIKFLESMPFGVSSVEGLEKLAKDTESSAHLPHVTLGSEQQSGIKTGAGGRLDLSTESGRSAAVKQRADEIRKQYDPVVLAKHMESRGQSVEDFARDELHVEFPKAGFIETKKTA
jgi:hypothetical protein